MVELVWLVSLFSSPLSLCPPALGPWLCQSLWAHSLDTCPHACLWGTAGALGLDLHACFALLLPLGSAQGIWSGYGVLLGPALGICSFWVLLSYNLGRNPLLEHKHHIGLGKRICNGCLYPSQGVFLKLNRTEEKERGWEESSMERMMMTMVRTWKREK